MTSDGLPKDVVRDADATLVRLVTSFATTADGVDRFVTIAKSGVGYQ
jgi:threonine aldolase